MINKAQQKLVKGESTVGCFLCEVTYRFNFCVEIDLGAVESDVEPEENDSEENGGQRVAELEQQLRQTMCVLCKLRLRNVVMEPCQHAALCLICARDALPENCPRCGDAVERTFILRD